jgi:hypothetical protein
MSEIPKSPNLPKTIDIPKRAVYRCLKCFSSRKNKYGVVDRVRARYELRDFWNNDKRYLKPIYVKRDHLWWRIYAIDWETWEMIVVLEDGSEIPPDCLDDIKAMIQEVVEHNKMKAMFQMFRDNNPQT